MSRRRRNRKAERRAQRREPSTTRRAESYSSLAFPKDDLSGLFAHEIERYVRNLRIARLRAVASVTARSVLSGRRFIYGSGVHVIGGSSRTSRAPRENTHNERIRLIEARVCAERRRRREVLHAFGRTGKGSGGGSKSFSDKSKVRC